MLPCAAFHQTGGNAACTVQEYAACGVQGRLAQDFAVAPHEHAFPLHAHEAARLKHIQGPAAAGGKQRVFFRTGKMALPDDGTAFVRRKVQGAQRLFKARKRVPRSLGGRRRDKDGYVAAQAGAVLRHEPVHKREAEIGQHGRKGTAREKPLFPAEKVAAAARGHGDGLAEKGAHGGIRTGKEGVHALQKRPVGDGFKKVRNVRLQQPCLLFRAAGQGRAFFRTEAGHAPGQGIVHGGSEHVPHGVLSQKVGGGKHGLGGASVCGRAEFGAAALPQAGCAGMLRFGNAAFLFFFGKQGPVGFVGILLKGGGVP